MRKQTKLVAVLSASALLAMGASMTSFAATGWTQEDGTWYYYDRDGSRVTDEWKKSGNYWFWLDDDGAMATDMLVEDNDDYYYVDVNGVMVTNRWVAVDNEDAGDDYEPDQYWYYFGSNGKAFQGNDNNSSPRFKTINGKRYAFDEDGKMLYGWVSSDGERQTDDDGWKGVDGMYYLGDENDGALKTGWQEITVLDEDWTDDNPYDENFDDEQTRWFYFKSNGKKYYNNSTDPNYITKTINGKKYGFDDNGRMVVEWNVNTTSAVDGVNTATGSITREWAYFSSPEDGARKTKGWYKVTPDHDLDASKYNDAEEFWYYSDGSGDVVANEVKTIKGKKYLFDQYGRMQDGLQLVQFESGSNKDVAMVYDDDDATLPIDTEDNFDATVKTLMAQADEAGDYAVMYFGDEDDGSMKTGKQTVYIDGDKFTFSFNKSGVAKGHGECDVDKKDKVAYAMGKQYKADSDNKYEVIIRKENTNGSGYTLESMSVKDFLDSSYVTSSGQLVYKDKDAEKEKYMVYYDKDTDLSGYVGQNTAYTSATNNVDNTVSLPQGVDAYVVNTSGKIIEKKSKCKDGDDIILDVSNWEIKAIYEELD